MDEHLRELLRALLEVDPDTTLDDDGRQAAMYAMLGLHSSEHIVALSKFAQSIESDFKRSTLLYNLANRSAQYFHFELAEKIARSIPERYWRFSALSNVASELLRRNQEFAGISVAASEFKDWALRLLSEIEKALPSIPQEDGDRATLLWRAGLSLIEAGKLEWAENLASTEAYRAENCEVLLRCAKAYVSRSEVHRALRLASAVGKLATSGRGQDTKRAYDLVDVSSIMFDCAAKEQARKYLEEARGFAFASQDEHHIDGCKCVGAVAIEFARQGHAEVAVKTAGKITQPARQRHAFDEIMKLTEPKS